MVDINNSDYGFAPDVDNNEILFGMKALSSVNNNVIEQIIAGRPYAGIADFMFRCPLGKKAMISLIKSGAFDKLEAQNAKELNVHPRTFAMVYYLSKVTDTKKRLTLQNVNGLIQKEMLPENMSFEQKVFSINKYLKKECKYESYYLLNDEIANFYTNHFNEECLEVVDGKVCIDIINWKTAYDDTMASVKSWIASDSEALLQNYNGLLIKENWDKYAQGTISAYEMESLCFYHSEHELTNVDVDKYGIIDFQDIDMNNQVMSVTRNGFPLFNISRIMGTVIGKIDNKSTVTLLTVKGVVNVKFSKEQYAKYKKQLSKVNPDGTKKVIEKGWFRRGERLVIAGYRREDTFVAKTYTKTPFHQVYRIAEIEKDGSLKLTHSRTGEENID